MSNFETKARGDIQDSKDMRINNDQATIFDEGGILMKELEVKENAKTEELQNIDATIYSVSIDELVIDYHLRTTDGNLDSLQGSIRRDGLQEPILVYKDEGGRLCVIDGCRRLAAVKEMGWKRVPCMIKAGIKRDEAAHLSYVKNMERNSLNAIEVALHIKAMRDDFGYTLRDLEIKGYGSAPALANKLKLLELPDKIQKQIQEDKITQAHGLSLTKLNTADEQIRFAKRIVDDDLTAKRTDIRIKKYLDKDKKKNHKPKVPNTPPGDIPGVYMKDSRDMGELPDKSVHLIMSSPPYFVGKEYEVGMSFEEHCEMVQDVLKECARVLKPGGIMALNVGDIHVFKSTKSKNPITQCELMGHRYQSWLRRHDIYLTDLIMWWKELIPWTKRPDIAYTPDAVHTSYRILSNFEPVYIFRKKGEREVPSEDVVLKSKITKEQFLAWTPGVWAIKPVHTQIGHPTIYPDELCSRLIKMFSYEGDTVLDPWLGSGTTVKVALELNRVGYGYERELQYKQTIMDRLGITNKVSGAEAVQQMAKNIEAAKDPIVTSDQDEEAPVVEAVMPSHLAVGSFNENVNEVSSIE